MISDAETGDEEEFELLGFALWAVIVIIAGAVIVIIILVVLAIYCCRKGSVKEEMIKVAPTDTNSVVKDNETTKGKGEGIPQSDYYTAN